MKISPILPTVFASLLLASVVYANPYPRPAACPDAGAIKARGLNYAIVLEEDNNTWQAGWLPSDNYQTEQKWVFYMGGSRDDTAKNKAEAMRKANAALQSLSFFQGPLDDKSAWLCYYLTDSKTAGIAITPPEALSKIK